MWFKGIMSIVLAFWYCLSFSRIYTCPAMPLKGILGASIRDGWVMGLEDGYPIFKNGQHDSDKKIYELRDWVSISGIGLRNKYIIQCCGNETSADSLVCVNKIVNYPYCKGIFFRQRIKKFECMKTQHSTL